MKQGIPGLTPEEVEAHTQAVADVLNSVLTSQIQIVDAAKEENQLKNLIAGSPTDPDAGKHYLLPHPPPPPPFCGGKYYNGKV